MGRGGTELKRKERVRRESRGRGCVPTMVTFHSRIRENVVGRLSKYILTPVRIL